MPVAEDLPLLLGDEELFGVARPWDILITCYGSESSALWNNSKLEGRGKANGEERFLPLRRRRPRLASFRGRMQPEVLV